MDFGVCRQLLWPTPTRVTSPEFLGAEDIDLPVSHSAGKFQSMPETVKPALVITRKPWEKTSTNFTKVVGKFQNPVETTNPASV
jgi:hypothetical protein